MFNTSQSSFKSISNLTKKDIPIATVKKIYCPKLSQISVQDKIEKKYKNHFDQILEKKHQDEIKKRTGLNNMKFKEFWNDDDNEEKYQEHGAMR